MKALFIGRFQPFHLGHLQVIQRAIHENDHLYIGIGSADASYRPANPLTCSERFQLIELALTQSQVPSEKYTILPVPNIKNYAEWVTHVESYIPPFHKLYTGSATVLQLFADHNKKVKKPYEIVPIEREIKISGTDIREKMVKNRKWDQHVHESIASQLEEWQIPLRIASVMEE